VKNDLVEYLSLHICNYKKASRLFDQFKMLLKFTMTQKVNTA